MVDKSTKLVDKSAKLVDKSAKLVDKKTPKKGTVGRVQWRGTVGTVDGYGGSSRGVRWRGTLEGSNGAVEGYSGYCGGMEWGPAGKYARNAKDAQDV